MEEKLDVVISSAEEGSAAVQPVISVVVPVCNVADYLSKCLDSIVKQTLNEIEIICVNAGSSDAVSEIINRFAAKDDRIRRFDYAETVTSYGALVNMGISLCRGDYICVVQSEDLIDRTMLEKLYSMTLDNETDVVCGSFCDYFDNGIDLPSSRKNVEKDFILSTERPFALKDKTDFFWGDVVAGAALYKREFIENVPIRFAELEGNRLVEEPFYTRVLCEAKKIMWYNEGLYFRRNNSTVVAREIKDDPSILIERMTDSLRVLMEYPYYNDIKLKKCAFARALARIKKTEAEFDTDKKSAVFRSKVSELLALMDENIIATDFSLHEQYDYYTYASSINNLKSHAPKLLIYNWLPFDNPWGWGGGVTVYCKNVISEIIKNNPDIDIYFLSSGFAYSAATADIFYRKIGNIFGDRVKQYEIVNSPVPAEQRNLYVNPLVALENKRLKGVVSEFIRDYGPFDAIHFNNIEGLSLDVLDLKEEFPDTRFLFSIHNYVPLCVNGSYYMRHKHCNCNPDHTGLDCFKCTRMDIRSDLAQATYNRGLYGQDKKKCISSSRWIKSFGFERLDEDVSPDDILDFAKTATAKINKNCDEILAVSQRVYDIAAENGFDESRMRVQYIGTKVADKQMGHASAEPKDGLRIVFLGSDINFEEKGYAFLLDTLEKLDIRYSSKIDLFLTVKQAEHAEIYSMLRNFRSVKVQNGYTHDDLGWIFKDANLSIVPVLWEDNLPQIAIESVAYGVPVLASSAGGAKELCDSELFRFECADSDDMNAKIMHFVDHPEDLQEYWKHHHGLVTMKQHWSELSQCYGIKEDAVYQLSAGEFNSILKENMFLRKNISLNEAKFTPSSVVEELNRKLREANEKNKKLEQEIKDMQKFSGKCIFVSEYDPIQGEVGTEMFKIVLDDFEFSDFYAEIRFVRLNNVTFSSSDTLRISGTLFRNGDKNKLNLHQIDWANDDHGVSDMIYYYIRGNELYFFCKYTDIYSGFAWEVENVYSRAAYDSARYEKLAQTMIPDNRMLPKDAFNSMGMMVEKLMG